MGARTLRVQSWREGQHYILHDADLMPQPSPDLFSVDYWQAQGRLEGGAPGRGAVAFVRSGDQVWALRHYRRGGFAANFSEDAYLWISLEASRPWREFRLTARLHARGLPVPRPIAAHLRRLGLRYRGDFITERISGAEPLAERLSAAPLPKAQWTELGRLLRRFHDVGVRHDDINARNILYRAGAEGAQGHFYLIDFDKARVLPAGAWRERNLARFKRSLEKFKAHTPGFRFEPADWVALMSGVYP